MAAAAVVEETHANADAQPRKNYRISISPVTPDALPDLATAELLAFGGASDAFIHRISPLSSALFRSGVHPRFWPDYQSTLRTREQNLRGGKIMLMGTAEEVDAEGRPVDSARAVPIAWARICPPPRLQQELLARRPLSARLLGDYVFPAVSTVRERLLGEEADGTDRAFLAIWKAEMERVRNELMGEDDWLLEVLVVHPAYQHAGVGGAMIRHCLALADSTDPLATQYPVVSEPPSHPTNTQAAFSSQVPSDSEAILHEEGSASDPPPSKSKPQSRPVQIFLEATEAGKPLYERYGFHTVYVSEIVYQGETISWPVMVCERGL